MGYSDRIKIILLPNWINVPQNISAKVNYKFTQPVTGADFIGFTEYILTKYFINRGFRKVGEKYFYEDTPYADIEKDIIEVARAINCKQNGEEINFKAPAFYENMMSLVYRKED